MVSPFDHSEHSNQTTGKFGEKLGEEYLIQQGYRILERNLRSPFGEIDLVAEHKGSLVFIEIKTRRDESFGFPEESVTRTKQKKLIQLANWYLARHFKNGSSPVRFDVLAIQIQNEKHLIRLIQNAIEVEI